MAFLSLKYGTKNPNHDVPFYLMMFSIALIMKLYKIRITRETVISIKRWTKLIEKEMIANLLKSRIIQSCIITDYLFSI